MEYEIGQIIELIHNNETIKLKIEQSSTNTCEDCFFLYKIPNCKTTGCSRKNYNLLTSFCSSTIRKDKKNIIYKQIK